MDDLPGLKIEKNILIRFILSENLYDKYIAFRKKCFEELKAGYKAHKAKEIS